MATQEEIYQLKESVASLESALLSAHPQIPTLLRTIHTKLKSDPELVTLLSDEEIGSIVSGLKRQTNTELVTKLASTKRFTASLKKLTVDDL